MRTLLAMALVLAIFIGGCATSGSNSAFEKDGFPKHEYCVGGGLSVEYQTYESGGTVILADNVSRKILLTKRMPPKSEFDFSMSPGDKSFTEWLKSIGIDPLNMKLSLYFVPDKKIADSDKK